MSFGGTGFFEPLVPPHPDSRWSGAVLAPSLIPLIFGEGSGVGYLCGYHEYFVG